MVYGVLGYSVDPYGLKSAQVPYAPPRFPIPVARCMIRDMVYLHKGCSRVIHRIAVVIPELRASRYEEIICVQFCNTVNQLTN